MDPAPPWQIPYLPAGRELEQIHSSAESGGKGNRKVLHSLAATTLAGLLAGSAPAWYASRVDPAETLKEDGGTGTSGSKHVLRRILVIGEFALALALLAGAGLTIHSFWNLAHADLGLKTDHVLTFYDPP